MSYISYIIPSHRAPILGVLVLSSYFSIFIFAGFGPCSMIECHCFTMKKRIDFLWDQNKLVLLTIITKITIMHDLF